MPHRQSRPPEIVQASTETEARARAEARRKAMDALARREHSRNELARKLAARGYDAGLVAEVLDALTAEKLQSDERYAESFVVAHEQRGQGPVRIRAGLLERGVDEALVERALGRLEVDWDRRAREVRRKKFGPEAPADFPDKARQMRFLAYRGFSAEQIDSAFD